MRLRGERHVRLRHPRAVQVRVVGALDEELVARLGGSGGGGAGGHAQAEDALDVVEVAARHALRACPLRVAPAERAARVQHRFVRGLAYVPPAAGGTALLLLQHMMTRGDLDATTCVAAVRVRGVGRSASGGVGSSAREVFAVVVASLVPSVRAREGGCGEGARAVGVARRDLGLANEACVAHLRHALGHAAAATRCEHHRSAQPRRCCING